MITKNFFNTPKKNNSRNFDNFFFFETAEYCTRHKLVKIAKKKLNERKKEFHPRSLKKIRSKIPRNLLTTINKS